MIKTFLIEGHDEKFSKRLEDQLDYIQNSRNVKIVDIKFSSAVEEEGALVTYSALIIWEE